MKRGVSGEKFLWADIRNNYYKTLLAPVNKSYLIIIIIPVVSLWDSKHGWNVVKVRDAWDEDYTGILS